MDEKIVFFITSVIYYVEKPLSYSAIRSSFSPTERAAQTMETINSIRMSVPSAKIVLIEMGLKRDLPYDIQGKVDKYIYLGDKKLARFACDSKFKGLGEAIGLIMASKQIRNMGSFYYKISGRYSLTKDFNIKEWSFDKFNVLRYENSISTRLYGFSEGLFKKWERALLRSVPHLIFNKSIENVLPAFITKKFIHELNHLGVRGNVAPGKSYIEE